jgi:hypothetical protein
MILLAAVILAPSLGMALFGYLIKRLVTRRVRT